MRILSVVGARPEFIQVAPLVKALRETEHQHVIVHSGQHYDELMSDVFFADLSLPAPDVMLGVGSGRHGEQTGRIMERLDDVLVRQRPDWVVVFGDTNSTLAGAVCAAKLHLPVAHVEAGLRSFNRVMPEEINRILTDHAADLLFAPTDLAMRQLATEGLAQRARLVGDIKTEITYWVRDQVADQPAVLPPALDPGAPFALATLHRAENTDDPERLASILKGLGASPVPVVLLAHPRLRARARALGLGLDQGALVTTDPLPYPQLVATALRAQAVITDSGGLQKEAFLLRVPCITVRTETEWSETVDLGWNVLSPDPADVAELVRRPRPAEVEATPYGLGDTAMRIVGWLEDPERGPAGLA